MSDSKDQDHVYDVVIIGAGFTGMSAALHLKDSNITNVCILEGNNRIGGRVYNQEVILDNGTKTCCDVGGAYTGPHQNRLLNLSNRFNIPTYSIYNKGKDIIKFANLSMNSINSFDALLTAFDWNNFVCKIDYLCNKLKNEQLTDEEFDKYNNISILDWINNNITNINAKYGIIGSIEVSLCYDLSKISFISLIEDINATININYFFENDGGAQDSKFTGKGTFGILLKMEEYLTNNENNNKI